jgi:pyruvate dehydrogenase E2 component (dihydrolipoamide acetyltransferase)
VVPVLQRADALGLAEIAARREDLVTRAQAGRLRLADIQGGSFTISNLGMYGVDAFSRHRQSAAGRHSRRGPDRRARGAAQRPAGSSAHHGADAVLRPPRAGRRPRRQFLGALAELIEEPLALLV